MESNSLDIMEMHFNRILNSIKREDNSETENNHLDSMEVEENNISTGGNHPENNFERMKNKNKKKSLPVREHHFKKYILRLNRVLGAKQKFGQLTLQEIDDYLSHIVDILESELLMLSNKSRIVTLSYRDLETVLKLRLPKKLADDTMKYGQKAVENYFANIREPPEMKVFRSPH